MHALLIKTNLCIYCGKSSTIWAGPDLFCQDKREKYPDRLNGGVSGIRNAIRLLLYCHEGCAGSARQEEICILVYNIFRNILHRTCCPVATITPIVFFIQHRSGFGYVN